MKTLKNLLIGLFLTLFTINSFAVTDTITFNSTSNVTCSVGDILNFRATGIGAYGISIGSFNTTGTAGTVGGMIKTSGVITKYTILGGETSFTITNQSGVSWSGTITIVSGMGVNDIKNQPTIKVFPNPVVDILKVSTSEKTKINIFNINGQSVLTQDLEKGTNDVDVFTLSNGIYFVTIGNKTQKIIKE